MRDKISKGIQAWNKKSFKGLLNINEVEGIASSILAELNLPTDPEAAIAFIMDLVTIGLQVGGSKTKNYLRVKPIVKRAFKTLVGRNPTPEELERM